MRICEYAARRARVCVYACIFLLSPPSIFLRKHSRRRRRVSAIASLHFSPSLHFASRLSVIYILRKREQPRLGRARTHAHTDTLVCAHAHTRAHTHTHTHTRTHTTHRRCRLERLAGLVLCTRFFLVLSLNMCGERVVESVGSERSSIFHRGVGFARTMARIPALVSKLATLNS